MTQIADLPVNLSLIASLIKPDCYGFARTGSLNSCIK